MFGQESRMNSYLKLQSKFSGQTLSSSDSGWFLVVLICGG